jgi:RNA polymerase sigma factor (sigma-70 family)
MTRADQGSVRAAIAALPDVFREAIVMREINGLSYREIAQAAGIPIGTVMSRLARARMMLMNTLGRPA